MLRDREKKNFLDARRLRSGVLFGDRDILSCRARLPRDLITRGAFRGGRHGRVFEAEQ